MAYLTIDGKLALYNGKPIVAPSGTGTIGEAQTKTVTPTTSQQTVTADSGYYLESVTVNAIPSNYIVPSGTITITANGTHEVTKYKKATVNVPIPTVETQTKTVTPTKSSQTVTPDSGYDGLSKVTVNAIPDNYIDTSDGTATPSDIASGKTAYVNGEKITGTDTCPEISFNEASGVLTISGEKIENKTPKLINRSITEITADDMAGITIIGDYAFSYCKSLASMTIPNSVTSIGDSAFYFCKSLTNLTIPNTVKSFGYSALNSCSSLTSVTIPDGASYLGGYLLYACSGLETVKMNLANVTSINTVDWFYNCHKLKNVEIKNNKWSMKVGSGTSYGHSITVDSLIYGLIAELIDVGESRTLTVGSANLNKLASVYVKLVTDDGSGKKPFEVCGSTDSGAMLISEYVTLKNWVLA